MTTRNLKVGDKVRRVMPAMEVTQVGDTILYARDQHGGYRRYDIEEVELLPENTCPHCGQKMENK